MPAVRDFIRIFAPRRGEIVVDDDALDLAPPKRRRAAGRSGSAAGAAVGEPDRARPKPSTGPASRKPAAGRRGAAAEPVRRSRGLTGRRLMALEIDVLTLFPEMVSGPLAASIPGRIQERGIATIRTHDLRQWGIGRHRSVDDAPYGGGAGMVMRPEPIADGIDCAPPRRLAGDPDGPGRRGLRPGACPRPGGAVAPRVRLPPATRASTSASGRSSTSSSRSATTS